MLLSCCCSEQVKGVSFDVYTLMQENPDEEYNVVLNNVSAATAALDLNPHAAATHMQKALKVAQASNRRARVSATNGPEHKKQQSLHQEVSAVLGVTMFHTVGHVQGCQV
jgi:hypothetical protein